MQNQQHPNGSSSQQKTSETSLSLLRRLKMPDEDTIAWARLNHLYAPVVLYRCKRANLSLADAEDVIQETFRTVHMKIKSFERRHKYSFRMWLKSITDHKIGDAYKRLNKQARAEGGTQANLWLEQQPDLADTDESEAEERGIILQQAIGLAQERFESRSINAFLRVVIHGQTVESVAEELCMSLNAVYVAKSKILAFLRQELEVEFD